MKIGFIGGTGEEGMGLAYRFAKAGNACVIGSRAIEKAQAAVDELRAKDAGIDISAATNIDAATAGEILLVTTPYAALAATMPALVSALEGKIVVSTVVPMAFGESGASLLHVEAGSAAQELASLGPGARVVGAFQNLSAKKLLGDKPVEADVICCSDDADARHEIMALAAQIEGVRGIDGGALVNAAYVESITVLLVSINRSYKARAGIRVSGIKA